MRFPFFKCFSLSLFRSKDLNMDKKGILKRRMKFSEDESEEDKKEEKEEGELSSTDSESENVNNQVINKLKVS